MAQPRRAKKTDKNQQGIVGYLRGLPGVSVELDHDDILVGYRMQNYWFEIKNPEEMNKAGKPYKGRIQKNQERIQRTWPGQYNIVTTVDEILDIIGYA